MYKESGLNLMEWTPTMKRTGRRNQPEPRTAPGGNPL